LAEDWRDKHGCGNSKHSQSNFVAGHELILEVQVKSQRTIFPIPCGRAQAEFPTAGELLH
jgi:hypothetical protein